MTKYSTVILIVLFFQSCASISQHPDKPLPATQVGKKDADVKSVKKPVKKISITMIEEHIKKGEWKKVRQLVDEWKVKNQEVIKEIKSHIGLIKGFLTGYVNCVQMEANYSVSRKKVARCYERLIKHNWNKLPEKSYFSQEFAAYLTAHGDAIKKKRKRLRLAQEIEMLKEDVSKKMTLGLELRDKKKRTAREFFKAYDRCEDMEKKSPTAVINILTCYREVYIIRNRVFLQKEVSDKVFATGKELEKKLDLYHRKYDKIKGKKKKQKKQKQPAM